MQAALVVQQPHRLRDDHGAGRVVEPARGGALPHERLELLLEGDRVPEPDHLLGLCPRPRPDVDPELLDLRPLRLLVRAQKVEGPAADYAGQALPPMHPDPLPDRGDVVMPADAAEVQQAVLAYVVDQEPDLVDVPGQHDPGFRLRVQHRGDVAGDVRPDQVGVALRVAAVDLCGRLLPRTAIAGR